MSRAIGNWFWAAVAASLVVSLTPWAQFLLYPFKLFTTWVHECGHALMTVLVGGRVTSITIEPDTSGLTHSLVPASRVARGLVASSGYLGAAVAGCLLVTATRIEKWAHVILLSLLAIQLALNSVYDIRVLFLIDRGQSDAATMARLFLLPSWVWATSWMLMSVAMLSATLWMTRGRSVDHL